MVLKFYCFLGIYWFIFDSYRICCLVYLMESLIIVLEYVIVNIDKIWLNFDKSLCFVYGNVYFDCVIIMNV